MQTRFARAGNAHVAYRTFGDGPVDFLCMLGEYLPIDAIDEEPRYARAMNRLASLGRVILFNPRGIGLSDPAEGPPTPEQHGDDACAVLDAIGARHVTVFAWNIAAPTAIRFAARHADRTAALIIANGFARLLADTDYEGLPEERVTATAEQTTATDTESETPMFDFLSAFAPSVANDLRFRTWWDQAGHRGASPTRSRALWDMMMRADMRDELRLIVAPTLVLHRAGNLAVPISFGRYIADHVAGAQFVEVPGHDLMWWIGESDAVLDEIEKFVGSAGTAPRPRRRLATLLFVDVVGSTERAVSVGDHRWRELLDAYHDIVRRAFGRFEGVEVNRAGDGFLATFDMPADAVRCAAAITETVQALNIEVRAGVHTGEIEVVGSDVAGIGVHIAARVLATASRGEVWVSRTVTDLVAGSGLAFEPRGTHVLRGVPGEWQLFAVRA